MQVNGFVARGHFLPSGGIALDRQLLQPPAGEALQGRSADLASFAAALRKNFAPGKGSKTQDESKIDTRVIWMSDTRGLQKVRGAQGGQKRSGPEKVLEKCAVSALAARVISNGCDTSVPSRN